MKRTIKIFVISALFFLAPVVLLAQNPPHPNGGNAPTPGNNTPVGGGAPIGSGLVMLMTMGVAYGAKKVYNFRKEE